MTPAEKAVTRRTVAKGAAWSVPVIALASSAAAATASGSACPSVGCATELTSQVTLGTVGIGPDAFLPGTNNATLSIYEGFFAADLLTTSCRDDGLLRPSLVSVSSVTLTMSDNATYPGTGLRAGVTAASITSLATVGTSFAGVHFPNGWVSATFADIPVWPVGVCIAYDLILDVVGSGTSPTTVTCPGRICFGISEPQPGSGYNVNHTTWNSAHYKVNVLPL